MKRKIFTLLTLFILFFVIAKSQTPQRQSPKPLYGKAGIKKKFSELKNAPIAAHLRKTPYDTPKVKPIRTLLKNDIRILQKNQKNGASVPLLHEEEGVITPGTLSAKSAMSSASTQEIASNYLSIDFYENPIGWPPDPNGAVGSSQVIVASNNGIKIHEKNAVTDVPIVTPKGYSRERAPGLFISLEEFFSPVLQEFSFIGDPHIRFDRLTKRWFIVAIDFQYNEIFIAISDGDRVTSSSEFTFYSFDHQLFPYDPNAPYAPIIDYPRLGVDKNAVIIGGNQFGWDSLTNVGYVIDKMKLINGELVVYPFQLGVVDFISGNVYGMYTPQGVYNDNPSSKESFFAGISYYQDGLKLASIEYGKNNKPWLSSEETIPVESFNNPRENSHPGSMVPLDMIDTRLFEASIYKNKVTGNSHLWTAHAIGVNQHGHYISGTDSDFVRDARTGARFYQIGNIYRKPYLNQVGTLYDKDEKSGRRAVQYFNPTIATNGQGHSVIGGTTDAFDQYLNVFVAGRYHGDTKGTLKKAVKPTNTTAIYAPYVVDFFGRFYINRWGDYSQTVVDPVDDQTIWTFQEYANVDDSYGIRVVQLKAPAPATPLPFGPLSNNKDTVIILKGTSVDNSGFFDPGKDEGGPGYKRLSVKSTGGVIVSNVKFWDPTKISFKLNTKNKPAGKYFLLITNPDGQIAVTEYTIEAPAPTLAASQRPALGSENKISNNGPQKNIVTSDIFPNPTSGNFKLQLNAAKDFKGRVLLITSEGKVISENSISFIKGSAGVPLTLANLGNGDYLAAVYNEDNVLIAVHKVIKQQ